MAILNLAPVEIILLVAVGLATLLAVTFCVLRSGASAETPRQVVRPKRSAKGPSRRSSVTSDSSSTPTGSEQANRQATTAGNSNMKEHDSMTEVVTGTLWLPSEQAVRSAAAAVLDQVPLPPNMLGPQTGRQQSPKMGLDQGQAEAHVFQRSELQIEGEGQRMSTAGLRQNPAALGDVRDGQPWSSKVGGWPESGGASSPQQAQDVGTTRKSLKSWVPTSYDIEEVCCVEVQKDQSAVAFLARRQSSPPAWSWQPPDGSEGRRAVDPLGDHSDVLSPNPARTFSECTVSEISIV
mmetsp:Transcript_1760/g.5571  ORF Transcript_1760/g.5571 Transcript_1760/m.5571 type:complete len:294 (-) Transcript_1760:61-942(-)